MSKKNTIMTESEYWYNRANNDTNCSTIQHQETMSALVQQTEMNLFSMLKPKIYIDGNQWCVLYGENLQDGICGFGINPMAAIMDFSKAFYQPVKTLNHFI